MDVAIEALRFERRGRVVLDVAELVLRSGTTTAVFGPNGSGKTTLLRLVAGLERPTAGRVRLGSAQGGARPPTPLDIAMAFQEPVFVRGTVLRNLELALSLRRLPDGERAARIAEAARECGIAHLLDRPARQLSIGEAQRASLARTLALRAPITLLDEPLAGIDRLTRVHLLDDLPRLLTTFATTTVLVTHDREEAFRLADHLVILVDGRVRAAGPKRSVYGHPPDRITAELLGYTVLESEPGPIAVPPGGLVIGAGTPQLAMVVDRVADMGHHRHVLGRIGTTRVDFRLPVGAPDPVPGSLLDLHPQAFVPLP